MENVTIGADLFKFKRFLLKINTSKTYNFKT